MSTPLSRYPLAAIAALTVVLSTACGAPAPTPTPAGAAATSASAPTGGPTAAGPLTAGSSAAAAPAAQRVELRYAGGAVAGGVARVKVALDSAVVLVVTSDVAEELHLHGYDRTADIPAGATATVEFTADLPGIFEVELERGDVSLARIEVS